MAVFGAGLALGIALGAGIALLTAPQSGAETRADLQYGARRSARAIGRRSRNAWLDLRDELRGAKQSIRRRKARRAAERARRDELERESASARP
jgi:gas vesicle protein